MIVRKCQSIVEENLSRFSAVRLPDRRLLAIEIKKSSAPKVERGFLISCQDIEPTHRFVVYDGEEKFSLGNKITALSIVDMVKEINGS